MTTPTRITNQGYYLEVIQVCEENKQEVYAAQEPISRHFMCAKKISKNIHHKNLRKSSSPHCLVQQKEACSENYFILDRINKR